jgi:hypothetical protein
MKERKVVATKLISQLRRLRLRKGDIVVVRDPEVMHALATLGEHASEFPPHAVIFAANGLEQVSLDDLKGLVSQLEREAALDKEESKIISGD